jgi:hypothetical protein
MLVYHTTFLRGISLKHNTSLRTIGSERTWCGLSIVRESLRVVGTAHEEQRIDSIFLCLLTRHA